MSHFAARAGGNDDVEVVPFSVFQYFFFLRHI